MKTNATDTTDEYQAQQWPHLQQKQWVYVWGHYPIILLPVRNAQHNPVKPSASIVCALPLAVSPHWGSEAAVTAVCSTALHPVPIHSLFLSSPIPTSTTETYAGQCAL